MDDYFGKQKITDEKNMIAHTREQIKDTVGIVKQLTFNMKLGLYKCNVGVGTPT
jgi:hypothetical protein